MTEIKTDQLVKIMSEAIKNEVERRGLSDTLSRFQALGIVKNAADRVQKTI